MHFLGQFGIEIPNYAHGPINRHAGNCQTTFILWLGRGSHRTPLPGAHWCVFSFQWRRGSAAAPGWEAAVPRWAAHAPRRPWTRSMRRYCPSASPRSGPSLPPPNLVTRADAVGGGLFGIHPPPPQCARRTRRRGPAGPPLPHPLRDVWAWPRPATTRTHPSRHGSTGAWPAWRPARGRRRGHPPPGPAALPARTGATSSPRIAPTAHMLYRPPPRSLPAHRAGAHPSRQDLAPHRSPSVHPPLFTRRAPAPPYPLAGEGPSPAG